MLYTSLRDTFCAKTNQWKTPDKFQIGLAKRLCVKPDHTPLAIEATIPKRTLSLCLVSDALV